MDFWEESRRGFALAVILVCVAVGIAQSGEVHDAAKKGNFLRVQRLFKARPNLVNDLDGDGRTPLFMAIERDDRNFTEWLLASGAKAQLSDKRGLTPLHLAAAQDNLEIVKLLMAKGAVVNVADKEGRTPLHWVAEEGTVETARLLLSYGSDRNARDKEGRTPLHLAAASGQTELVMLLLDKGADVNLRDKRGRTPLKAAKERYARRVEEALPLRTPTLHAVDRLGGASLDDPRLKESQDLLDLLRKHGARE